MMRRAPTLADVHHVRLCYSKVHFCGHPRQCGIFNYGNGEVAVVHHHARCAYQTQSDIQHGQFGYKGRAKILLQRSFDHCQSWPSDQEVVVWDDSLPLEAKRAILWRADDTGIARAAVNLAGPNAAIYFARPATGLEDTDGRPTLECFAFRSEDRGRTWEKIPVRVRPPNGFNYVHVDGYPLVKFPDGTQMTVASLGGSGSARRSAGVSAPNNSVLAAYASDDNGENWDYVSEVARDVTGNGRPTYGNLLRLPSGRLQCYMLQLGGVRHALQMAHSDDGGYSWSEARPIVTWGNSPWTESRGLHAWPGARTRGPRYRSPWPVRLQDGRIVVLFGRRKRPFGIGLIVSEDDGSTWSTEAVLRDDASDWDLGYPVATQLDDGRVFTAYYFMQQDGNQFGGTRFIAGSFFRLS